MSLDIKRKQLELSRVGLAREEMELKIEECLEQIAKYKNAIEVQMKKEEELKADIAALTK